MNQLSDDIIEIDGQKYLVPNKIKDGELVRDLDSKIKLPIQITDSFRFTKRSIYEDEPKPVKKSLLSRLLGRGSGQDHLENIELI
jgi:hypothetical protein